MNKCFFSIATLKYHFLFTCIASNFWYFHSNSIFESSFFSNILFYCFPFSKLQIQFDFTIRFLVCWREKVLPHKQQQVSKRESLFIFNGTRGRIRIVFIRKRNLFWHLEEGEKKEKRKRKNSFLLCFVGVWFLFFVLSFSFFLPSYSYSICIFQ